MKNLPGLLRKNEDNLMERVLSYARRQEYTKYTSTLKEAWRISIQGLTEAICSASDKERDLELTPDEDYTEDPVTAFGILEAKRHRGRGITLAMFLGLFKYYREAYYDLVREEDIPPGEKEKRLLYLSRAFDRIEIGFSSEWAQMGDDSKYNELRESNRYMTNEKNMYLTIAESIASSVFVTDLSGGPVYMNRSASKMLGLSPVPGGYYYNRGEIDIKLPEWLQHHLNSFLGGDLQELVFDAAPDTGRVNMYLQGRIAPMEDVSGKYSGVVIILNDVNELKKAEQQIRVQRDELEKVLDELKVLHGILPICSRCKKIRNENGEWSHVEVYVKQHTSADFSHSLCPECAKKLYPGMDIK